MIVTSGSMKREKRNVWDHVVFVIQKVKGAKGGGTASAIGRLCTCVRKSKEKRLSLGPIYMDTSMLVCTLHITRFQRAL